MNIAELGIKVDSTSASQAADDLDKLTKSGAQAEQSTVSLMDQMKDLEKSLANGAKSTQELAKQRSALAQIAKTGAYNEAELAKAGATLDKQQVALAKSTMDEQKALNSLLGAIDPSRAALAKLEKQTEDLGKAFDAGKISQKDYEAALSKLDTKSAGLEKTGNALDGLNLKSRAVKENITQLGNAFVQGDFAGVARNIAQLGAEAGSSAGRIAALVAPYLLLAAAVGGLVYAYEKGKSEAKEYTNALILTGNSVGESTDQLGEMAKQISATVGTTGQAAEVLATLAASGKIAGDSFVSIGKAAVSMREATGKAIADTVAEFVKIADEPVKASIALNDQYHYLTASVYSQIAALDEQGNHSAAVKLATEQYADAINDRTPKIIENLSYWEKGYNAVAKAADALKNIGRSNIDDDIADAQQKLDRANAGDIGFFQKKDVMVEYYTDQLNFLKDTKAAKEADAKYFGEQAKSQQEAIVAMGKIDALTKSSWSNEEKRTDEIKKYRQELEAIRKVDPTDKRLDQTTVDKNIANINDKYKDPKAAAVPIDNTDFNNAKNILAASLGYYKNLEKELEASQKAGLISQESYTSQRIAIVEQEREEVTHGYELEIAALEASKSKKGVTAQQSIELDQKIADARANMVKAQTDADSELAVIATNEEGRLKKQTLAVQTYTDALQLQVATLKQQGIQTAAGVGQGDRERSLSNDLIGIDKKSNSEQKNLADQYGDGSRGMSLDEYNAKLKAVKKNQQDLRDITVQNFNEMTEAQGDWAKGAERAFKNFAEDSQNIAATSGKIVSDVLQGVTDGVSESIASAIVQGDDLRTSLANVAQTIETQLIASLIKLGIQYAVNAVIGQTVGATATAASAALAATTAAAWAPAAALVSLASFGANSIPATAALLSTAGVSEGIAVASVAGGFQEGGYTGAGAPNEIAGVVHKGEYVMSAPAVARIGLSTLDNLHNGEMEASSPAANYGAGGAGANGSGQSNGGSQPQVVQHMTYVFPNVTNSKEAKTSTAQAARQAGRAVSGLGRYS